MDDFDGDTFRTVYTVRFAEIVYVLHAFQKKSKRGIATPQTEMELVGSRLRRAAEDYKRWSESEKAKIRVSAGGDNVFADIGLPEPEEELAKAQLASCIRQTIRRQRLTQVAAASRMGIDQPKVSAILNGRLANFSSHRLMRLLTTLGQDIEIRVKPKPRNQQHGQIRVTGEMLA